MKRTLDYLLPLLFLSMMVNVSSAIVIESWQFNETAGTQFTGLINDAGSASFSSNKAQVVTDGVGALEFSQGSSGTDNIFRNATLTAPNQTTGTFEMEFSLLAADLSGGDATGANIGFGFRESGSNTDLFLVRLHEQSGTLRLQTRISGTNTNLHNFGADALIAADTPLLVRAVADLDNDLLDVFYTLGAGAEQSALAIAIPNLEFDQIRMVANTNNTDWGATDVVTLDYLTLSTEASGGGGDFTLDINTTTGLTTITNGTGVSANIAGYQITSASDSLNPAGWNSLQDQNLPGFPAGDGSGNGWEELGVAADYNGDGTVDAADYTVWRDAEGNTVSAGTGADGTADGVIDTADYDLWASRFGEGRDSLLAEAFLTGDSVMANGASFSIGNAFEVGGMENLFFEVLLADGSTVAGTVVSSSSSSSNGQAVPEPTTLLLLVLGSLSLSSLRGSQF